MIKSHQTYMNLTDVFQTNVCCRSLSSVVKRAHAGGAAAPNSDVLACGPLNPRAPDQPLAPSLGGAFLFFKPTPFEGTLSLTQRYLVSWEG
jgi:hypothetical protein